jgi:sorbitol-specific phosphotransferase system component IIC
VLVALSISSRIHSSEGLLFSLGFVSDTHVYVCVAANIEKKSSPLVVVIFSFYLLVSVCFLFISLIVLYTTLVDYGKKENFMQRSASPSSND